MARRGALCLTSAPALSSLRKTPGGGRPWIRTRTGSGATRGRRTAGSSVFFELQRDGGNVGVDDLRLEQGDPVAADDFRNQGVGRGELWRSMDAGVFLD